MALDIKYPPAEWERITGVQIIDADGWAGNMLDYETPITRDDFLIRAANSTAQYPKGFFDQYK